MKKEVDLVDEASVSSSKTENTGERMKTVENSQYFFEFVNADFETEYESEKEKDSVHDPISTSGNILKEELDLAWEEKNNENHDDLSVKLKDLSSYYFSNMVPRYKNLQGSVCVNCGKKFMNELSLHLHSFKCILFECDHCPYKNYKRNHIRRHIFNVHMAKDPVMNRKTQNTTTCSPCGTTYKNKNVLRNHLTFCQKNLIQCHYCSYQTPWFSSLKKHVLLHHLEDATNQVCSKCGKIVKNKLSMRYHYFDCLQSSLLRCNYCDFNTKYSFCLKKHLLKQHMDLEQPKFECPKCYSKLKTRNHFQKHLLRCFTTKCGICDYRAAKPSKLREHVLERHF